MTTRCVLPSPAQAVEAKAIDGSAIEKRRRVKPDITGSLWPDQSISVFGERQDLANAELNGGGVGNDLGPLSRLALDRVDGIQADVETHALRDQAFHQLAVRVPRAQQ